MGRLKIDLLGSHFSVSAGEDDEYLKKLFDYYSEIVKAIQSTQNIKDPLKTSIMAGVSLVDELYKEKQKSQSYKRAMEECGDPEADKIAMELIEKIDGVL